MADRDKADNANGRSGPALGNLKIREMYQSLCSGANISYDAFTQAVEALPDPLRDRRGFTSGMAALTARLIASQSRGVEEKARSPRQLSLPLALFSTGNGAEPTDP